MDNGPELLSRVLVDWCEARGVAIRYIRPGKPIQNAIMERFNKTYRIEVLDLDILTGAGETSLQTLRDFLYKSAMDVLSTSSGWCYWQFPNDYATCVGTLDPAFAYPSPVDHGRIVWNSDWAACYARASVTPRQSGSRTAIDPSILCTIPGSVVDEFDKGTGYASNLAPAIAYAVDHGATGTAAAYARWSGANNYATFDALRTQRQRWAIIPRYLTMYVMRSPSAVASRS